MRRMSAGPAWFCRIFGTIMARMRRPAPREQGLRPRGFNTVMPVRSRNRIDSWRNWSETAEWRGIRWDALVAANFTCVRCRHVHESNDLVGDRDLFVHRSSVQRPASSVQCMCANCYNGDKQRVEQNSISAFQSSMPLLFPEVVFLGIIQHSAQRRSLFGCNSLDQIMRSVDQLLLY